MDRLEKYEFENPLLKIGIDSLDIYSLKRKASKLIVQIKEALYEKNKPISDKLNQTLLQLKDKQKNLSGEDLIKCKKEIDKATKELNNIKKQKEIWYNDLDKRNIEINGTEDIGLLIYQIIVLNSSYLLINPIKTKDMTPEEQEYKMVSNDLSRSIKSAEDAKKLLIEKSYVLENIDTKNADLSRYKFDGEIYNKYGMPSYVCVAQALEEPRLIMSVIDGNYDKVQVYEIGTFRFGQSMNLEGRINFKSLKYDIVSVLKQSKNGDLRTYNGIIYFNESVNQDLSFWANVVFSDVVMKNAMKNNFGYIGTVEKIDGDRKLLFSEPVSVMEEHGEVKALSYFQKYGGQISGLPGCNDLQDFYRIMNDKAINISNLKPKLPAQTDREGR